MKAKTPKDLMNLAMQASKMSNAKLAKVGAVIVHARSGYRTVSFNGALFEEPELEYVADNGELVSKPGVIHAEAAAIADAALYGFSTDCATMYVTTAPCYRCASLIFNAGISKVYYRNKWWDEAALEYLTRNGVAVERLDK